MKEKAGDFNWNPSAKDGIKMPQFPGMDGFMPAKPQAVEETVQPEQKNLTEPENHAVVPEVPSILMQPVIPSEVPQAAILEQFESNNASPDLSSGLADLAAKAAEITVPQVGDRLLADQHLQPGESLESANHAYKLIYQQDGNLVLYRNSDGKPLWASGTQNQSLGRCSFQTDGHLVVYDAANKPVWASGKYGSQYANSQLIMQDDGNLVAYDPNNKPYWASGTHQK